MTEPEASSKTSLRDYYEALLIAVIFFNFARIFLVQMFKIPTGSMIDNLLVGDHIIVNKFIYGPPGPLKAATPLRDIRRADIVVFRFPDDPRTDYVKRVIGLPGETIRIYDKRVFVDGRELSEPYKLHEDPQIFPRQPMLPQPYRSRDQFGPFVVPQRHYFVMGDNRDKSNDSRYWGVVARDLIKGKAFLVYWSFRGVPPPPGSPPSARMRELLVVITHFLSNTRWDRTMFVVDSKYHYRPEPESLQVDE